MKKLVYLMVLSLLALNAAGCSKAAASEASAARSVSVIEATSEEMADALAYIGTVTAKELVRYSFKTPGKITEIAVEEGQTVHAGDTLAHLDPQELQFQTDAASAALQAAQAAARKAEEALAYDEAYLAKMSALLASQSISQDQFDQLALKEKNSRETVIQAREQVQALRADLEYKSYLRENTILKSESEGVVADILYEENEQVAAYYPVIVIRGIEQVVNVGIPQQDLEKLEIGAVSQVELDGQKTAGHLTSIAQAPDAATHTYAGEVAVTEGIYRLGAIVRVHIGSGTASGMWVPVGSILSEGESYVYTVVKDRAYRKVVEVQEIRDNRLKVTGLTPGDQVVVAGMKSLSDGMLIQVTEKQ